MTRQAFWRTPTIGLLLCLMIGALISVMRGQDSSWDLKNYHLYNAWALLHDHSLGSTDIAAAGLQSYFNPLPDLPYLWLSTHLLAHSPKLLAAFQGLWYGAFLYVLWGVGSELARQQQRQRSALDLVAFLIGATGTMVVSQSGLSSNEVMLATLVLLGLRLAMPVSTECLHPGYQLLASGLCCGLAAGLKPTAIVYAPALALALCLTADNPRQGVRHASMFTLASVAGFSASYGWWGWLLWSHTDNPVFPLFNQIFHSPLTTTSNLADQRFKPRSLIQWLIYPAYWLQHTRMLVTEPTFADGRYLLAMLSALALAIKGWLARATIPTQPGRSAQRLLLGFVCSAYMLWLLLFSILRYAIPIEALTGLLMLLAVQAWIPSYIRRSERLRGWAMALLLLLSAGSTDYPGWGHSNYSGRGLGVPPIQANADSTVILLGQPTAYLVPFFEHADSIRFIGINEFIAQSFGAGLWRQTQQALRQARGPIFVVRRDDVGQLPELLAKLIPDLRIDKCQPIISALETGRNGKDFSDHLRICQAFVSDTTGG